jgi:hypothetical protein
MSQRKEGGKKWRIFYKGFAPVSVKCIEEEIWILEGMTKSQGWRGVRRKRDHEGLLSKRKCYKLLRHAYLSYAKAEARYFVNTSNARDMCQL